MSIFSAGQSGSVSCSHVACLANKKCVFFLQANPEAGPASHMACLAHKKWFFFLQANPEAGPANHVACTVEMSNLAQQYEVAVIDEIQVQK
jgi:hypothetical protein